jgi:hypothetical protein
MILLYLKWPIAWLALLVAALCATSPLWLAVDSHYQKWRGTPRLRQVSPIPLIGTILSLLLLVAFPFHHSFLVRRLAFVILQVDLSYLLFSFARTLWLEILQPYLTRKSK